MVSGAPFPEAIFARSGELGYGLWKFRSWYLGLSVENPVMIFGTLRGPIA
jgi:hypothetical protein